MTLPLLFLAQSTLFVPIAPCRLIDTRNPVLREVLPIKARDVRTMGIRGDGCGDSILPRPPQGVEALAAYKTPQTRIAALSAVVTIIPQREELGYLTIWPDEDMPVVASIVTAGKLASSAVVIKTSTLTGESFKVFSNIDCHITIDVNGYYVPLTELPLTTQRPAESRDFEVGWGDDELLLGSNCTLDRPCLSRVGSVVYSRVAPATLRVASGSGVAYVYIDDQGELSASASSSAVRLSCEGCRIGSGNGFPARSIPLWTWTVSEGQAGGKGAFDERGGRDLRAVLAMERAILGAAAESATAVSLK